MQTSLQLLLRVWSVLPRCVKTRSSLPGKSLVSSQFFHFLVSTVPLVFLHRSNLNYNWDSISRLLRLLHNAHHVCSPVALRQLIRARVAVTSPAVGTPLDGPPVPLTPAAVLDAAFWIESHETTLKTSRRHHRGNFFFFFFFSCFF